MKYIKAIAKILIIGAIFFFIFRNLFSNLGQLQRLQLHFSYASIILSLASVFLAWVATSWSFSRMLVALNHRLAYKDVYSIYFRSLLGKYLPGKLWQIAGSTYLAVKKGVPEGISITAFVAGQGYSLLSGMALFGCVLMFGGFGDSGLIGGYLKWTSLPLVLIIIALAVKPKLFEPVMNLGLRLFGRQKVNIDIKFIYTIQLFLLFLLSWFAFGLSFWFFANALTPVSFGYYVRFTAIIAAANIIGFFAIFVPGGLGVREGMIVLLLSSLSIFPNPIPSAIALGFRVITTAGELGAFGLTWLIDRKPSKEGG